MGFCSGTDIFDPVVKQVLDTPDLSDAGKSAIIKALIGALFDHDWDCEDESQYRQHPLVDPVFRQVNHELGLDYGNEEDEETPDSTED